MDPTAPQMIEINPDAPHAPLTDEARATVAALAERQRRAQSLLMRVVTFAGGQVEDGMKMLPKGFRDQLEAAARGALTQSYDMAGRTRGTGLLARQVNSDRAHRVIATISGALGGLGGLPTALAELPIATTVIFRAVQGVAAAYDEDPADPATRLECLRVFGAGGQGEEDDGVDTTFIGARIGLTGPALHKLIAKVAPKFAAVLSQKLAAQAVPVIGAAAGAGTNYAFVDYYIEMAHVHFGLRRLTAVHGERHVLDLFHKVLAGGRLPANRA